MNLIEFFITPFTQNDFLLNALLATTLVSFACAGVGSLMILRGMTFIAEAFGHGMLPGIALAMIFGISGEIGAAISALAMILAISYISTHTNLKHDSAIGVSFIFTLALGVIIISYSGSFTGDLISALFGDPLGVSQNDILFQLCATIVILSTVFAFKRAFILLCISPDYAQTSGFNPKIYSFLTLLLIGAAVVTSFKTVGTALVVGMLIAPSATALLFAKNLSVSIFSAGLIGTLGSFLGLLTSYHYDVAAGAAITIACTTLFFIALVVKKI
jgi:ABC-type Mn2+/Zn2+ transport system permease subunit